MRFPFVQILTHSPSKNSSIVNICHLVHTIEMRTLIPIVPFKSMPKDDEQRPTTVAISNPSLIDADLYTFMYEVFKWDQINCPTSIWEDNAIFTIQNLLQLSYFDYIN